MSRVILSRNVRHFRRQNGWSQEQLADRCGLHRTYVGAIERGERNVGLDNLERLADALQVSASALLIDIYTGRQNNSVREPVVMYQSRQARRPLRIPPPLPLRAAAYSGQYATHSLSTQHLNLLVMSSHESTCKEASGTTCTTAAHQPRLVAGSACRAQRA
ncbi:MAG TPA: XRE family transcriptional regulator [Gammaproteobacteria bacterium]|nr:XRE family transcriptional regulator [Gammaproteobacteria bacterium]